MQYLNKTFTLPVTSKRMSQTEYEIAVGLRKPDGTLVQPRRKKASRFANPEWIAKNDTGRP